MLRSIVMNSSHLTFVESGIANVLVFKFSFGLANILWFVEFTSDQIDQVFLFEVTNNFCLGKFFGVWTLEAVFFQNPDAFAAIFFFSKSRCICFNLFFHAMSEHLVRCKGRVCLDLERLLWCGCHEVVIPLVCYKRFIFEKECKSVVSHFCSIILKLIFSFVCSGVYGQRKVS